MTYYGQGRQESLTHHCKVIKEELENEVQSLRADLKQMELHRDASDEKNNTLEVILKKSSEDHLKKCNEKSKAESQES